MYRLEWVQKRLSTHAVEVRKLLQTTWFANGWAIPSGRRTRCSRDALGDGHSRIVAIFHLPLLVAIPFRKACALIKGGLNLHEEGPLALTLYSAQPAR